MKRHRWPILTLFLLAPMTGELLSSSAPPAEFFAPPTFLMLAALYGSGALLIRELVRRRGKGWASILLLGLAYGIYEEGLVVRSFFDPAWGDLGLLAEYGRWLGVNWVWALELTIFHAVVSITLPIMIVELLFPAHRDVPWLSRSGLVVHSLLFLSLFLISPLFGMQASLLALLGCGLVIGLLMALAYGWPARVKSSHKQTKAFPVGVFSILGFLGAVGWFITIFVLPELDVPVVLDLYLAISWPLFITVLIWAFSTRGWHSRHQWGLSAGILALFVLFAFVAEANNAIRPDNTSGMALVGWAFLAFLGSLGLRILKRRPPERPQTQLVSGEV